MRSSASASSLPSSSSSPFVDDDEVEIIDVPLTQRLRQRPPPKEKAAVKRKRGGNDDDEDDEDEDDDDGGEDDVSVYSEGEDDSYGYHSTSRRSTSGNGVADDDFAQQKGGGRPVSAAELREFQDVVGSHLSRLNCIQLIKKAGYDVERAVNDYFHQVNDDGAQEEKKQPPTTPKRAFGRAASRGAFSLGLGLGGFSAAASTPSSSASRPSLASSLSSPSSSLSAFPEVQKPNTRQPAQRPSYLAPDSDDSFDSDDSLPRPRGRRRAPRQQAGAAGAGRRGRFMKKGGKGGKGIFDPTLPPPDFHSRPADSALPSAVQRMSSYKEGMKVDAKIAGHWSAADSTHGWRSPLQGSGGLRTASELRPDPPLLFSCAAPCVLCPCRFPVEVLAVYEVGHVLRVKHPDWPIETAVFIDPVTRHVAPAGSKKAEYYSYEQVETFTTAPPKPPHPDAALYLWPGVRKDDESGEASLFLGTLTCRVVSDRAYGMKEWYDCVVPEKDDEQSLAVWRVVDTWLKKQSKLVEVEEKVEEALQRGQPCPSVSSAAGKAVQARLHSSYTWKLMEQWMGLGYDVREVVRSHHTDEDEEVKRSEQINELVEMRGVAMRHPSSVSGQPDEMRFGLDASSDSGSTSSSMPSSNNSDDDDSDDEDGGGGGMLSVFQSVLGMAKGKRGPARAALFSSTAKGKKGKRLSKQDAQAARAEAESRAALASTAASARPLHTYTVTLNLFISLAAQKSSPASTSLSLTPLNALMAALYPRSAYPALHAMIDEAQAPVPSSLQPTVNLERLMSLSVRDEQGQPFFWEKLKAREAKAKQEAAQKAAEEEMKAREEAEAAGVKAGKKGRKAPAKKAKARAEEKKAEEKDEKADDSDDSMDIGVGEREEELSAACGLNITLRDYQTHTVSWMLEQEADVACTNMYLWTQLQFPDEAVTYARWKQSAAVSSSSSSAPPVVIPEDAEAPLFYFCPLLQRFRFKPLPLIRGGWNVEEMGLGQCFPPSHQLCTLSILPAAHSSSLPSVLCVQGRLSVLWL